MLKGLSKYVGIAAASALGYFGSLGSAEAQQRSDIALQRQEYDVSLKLGEPVDKKSFTYIFERELDAKLIGNLGSFFTSVDPIEDMNKIGRKTLERTTKRYLENSDFAKRTDAFLEEQLLRIPFVNKIFDKLGIDFRLASRESVYEEYLEESLVNGGGNEHKPRIRVGRNPGIGYKWRLGIGKADFRPEVMAYLDELRLGASLPIMYGWVVSCGLASKYRNMNNDLFDRTDAFLSLGRVSKDRKLYAELGVRTGWSEGNSSSSLKNKIERGSNCIVQANINWRF